MQAFITYLTAVWIALLSFFGVQGANNPITFIVFGDSGTGSEAQIKLAGVMEQYPVDLILHTGDIAYDAGTEEELQKNFFDVYAPILKKTPFYPAPGNHDYVTDNLGPYLTRFAKNKYYSFDTPAVHFVSLDVVGSIEEEMIGWLEEDLKLAQGKRWVVVYFHYPPFSSGSTHGGNKAVREQLVPLLDKYGVNFVFSGHEHHYERMKPINNVTYIITGGGGASLYDFGELAETSLVHAKEYHFVYMDATKCGMTGKAINIDNNVIDSFTLSRCRAE